MIQRQIVVDKLTPILKDIDPDYRVEQRVRRETFDASSRAKRLEILGDKTTYAEVLTSTPTFTGRRSSNKTPNYNYAMRVNVWYGYHDAQSYDQSSQSIFDDIVHKVLEGFSADGGTDREGVFYYIDEPYDASEPSLVSLSNDGKELAHYLTFRVNVRTQN